MIHHRKDIDGLRAVAILTVVIFHAAKDVLPGGFIGVDIFFVISGYLITFVIADEMQNGQFSFVNFYLRRARRLLPAFLVMALTITLFCALILLPNDLMKYGETLVYATLFGANLKFAHDEQYFDPDLQENPFLHTWSLGVEEQFYIFWPILLFLLVLRVRRAFLSIALFILFAASLIYSQWATAFEPRSAFFLLPSRAFELLLGAMIALNVVPRIKLKLVAEGLGLAGLILIGLGLLVLNEHSRFPGVSALLPCIGAAFVIYSGQEIQTVSGRFLATAPLVFIGLVSYSFYLWHWPLLSLSSYYVNRPLSLYEAGLCVTLAFLLGVLSWHFIERPFRSPQQFPSLTRASLFLGAAVTALMIITGSMFQEMRGLPFRVSAEVLAALTPPETLLNTQAGCTKVLKLTGRGRTGECSFGVPSSPGGSYDIVLWGDSNARHYLPAVAEISKNAHYSGLAIIMSGCQPLFNVLKYEQGKAEPDWKCADHNSETVNNVKYKLKPRLVILAARWLSVSEGKLLYGGKVRYNFLTINSIHIDEKIQQDVFSYGINNTIDQLTSAGIRVLILAQVPQFPQNPAKCLAKAKLYGRPFDDCLQMPRRLMAEHEANTIHKLKQIVQNNPLVSVFEPAPFFCDETACRAASAEGHLLYEDDNHITIEGARFIAPHLDLKPVIAATSASGQVTDSQKAQHSPLP